MKTTVFLVVVATAAILTGLLALRKASPCRKAAELRVFVPRTPRRAGRLLPVPAPRIRRVHRFLKGHTCA